MKAIFFFFCLCSLAHISSAQMVDSFNHYLVHNNQVLFVKTKSDSSVQGMMFLCERKNRRLPWKAMDSFPVVVGRSGLAKEDRSSLASVRLLPSKKEGDGKSPAGIFPLGTVFSYHPLAGLHMPFKQVDTACYCVDDTASSYYNTLVVNDTAKQLFNSFEYMKRKDDAYEYGVWVLYNSRPVTAGNGSCIFIHVWRNNSSGTAGCTAMAKENIIRLIHWLDEKKHPVLLQLVAR